MPLYNPVTSVSGNAATATALATARAIGEVNFDGTAAINPNLVLSAAHSADDSYTGAVIPGLTNLGGVTQWDTVYLDGSSRWIKADANGSSTYPARGLAVATALTTVVVKVLTQGTVRHDAWNWTPGGVIYLSGTAGGLTQTILAGSGDNVQQVGFALTADIAFFDFNSTFITLI